MMIKVKTLTGEQPAVKMVNWQAFLQAVAG